MTMVFKRINPYIGVWCKDAKQPFNDRCKFRMHEGAPASAKWTIRDTLYRELWPARLSVIGADT